MLPRRARYREAACRRLAAEGAKVAVFDMNLEAAEKVAADIRAKASKLVARL